MAQQTFNILKQQQSTQQQHQQQQTNICISNKPIRSQNITIRLPN